MRHHALEPGTLDSSPIAGTPGADGVEAPLPCSLESAGMRSSAGTCWYRMKPCGTSLANSSSRALCSTMSLWLTAVAQQQQQQQQGMCKSWQLRKSTCGRTSPCMRNTTYRKLSPLRTTMHFRQLLVWELGLWTGQSVVGDSSETTATSVGHLSHQPCNNRMFPAL